MRPGTRTPWRPGAGATGRQRAHRLRPGPLRPGRRLPLSNVPTTRDGPNSAESSVRRTVTPLPHCRQAADALYLAGRAERSVAGRGRGRSRSQRRASGRRRAPGPENRAARPDPGREALHAAKTSRGGDGRRDLHWIGDVLHRGRRDLFQQIREPALQLEGTWRNGPRAREPFGVPISLAPVDGRRPGEDGPPAVTLVRRFGRPRAAQRAERTALTWAFPGPAQTDKFPMPHDVECVAILEPAGKHA